MDMCLAMCMMDYKIQKFLKISVIHMYSLKPTCAECWAKFFCSGGCHANNITLGGDLETPYEFGAAYKRNVLNAPL